jgi:hypothetical protein
MSFVRRLGSGNPQTLGTMLKLADALEKLGPNERAEAATLLKQRLDEGGQRVNNDPELDDKLGRRLANYHRERAGLDARLLQLLDPVNGAARAEPASAALNLNKSLLGPRGLEALLAAARVPGAFPALRVLSLEQANMHADGALDKLARSMGEPGVLPVLDTLHLGRCEWYDRQSQVLLSFLRCEASRRLTALDLSGSKRLDFHILQQMIEELANWPNLRTLKVNEVDSAWIPLSTAFARDGAFPRLKVLGMGGQLGGTVTGGPVQDDLAAMFGREGAGRKLTELDLSNINDWDVGRLIGHADTNNRLPRVTVLRLTHTLWGNNYLSQSLEPLRRFLAPPRAVRVLELARVFGARDGLRRELVDLVRGAPALQEIRLRQR